MSIIVTGMAFQHCADLLRLAGPAAKLKHLPLQDVLTGAEGTASNTVVWIYHAPWSQPEAVDTRPQGGTVTELLALWLAQHRALLRKRRAFGKRLLLVNAEHVPSAALLARLGLKPLADQPVVAARNASSAVTAFLSQTFASAAPELWDVYESLEVLAWRPEGQDAAAHQPAPPSAEEGLRLYQMLLDGQALPAVKTALAQAQTEVAQLAGQLSATVATLDKAQADAQASQSEQALLQQALEVTRVQAARDKASTDAQTQQLQADLTLHVTQLANSAAALQQAQAAAAALGEQLASAQLESDVTCQQLTQELSELKAVLAAARQDEAQARAELAELRQENEEVWVQLHQTQEEVERYFLGNRQLQDSLFQSRDALDRARHMVARLVPDDVQHIQVTSSSVDAVPV